MKPTCSMIALSMFLLAAVPAQLRADDAKVQIQGSDTVKSVLERSAGQTVALRLGSGEDLKGKVAKVGDHVVHLTELSGREFFDAVVPLDAIQAVILKARSQ